MNPAAGIIGVDLPCLRCRYSLRGMDAGGVCPECALPVRESLNPRRLVLADPGWLRRAERGALLLGGVVPAYVFLMIAAFLFADFLSAPDRILTFMVMLPALLPVLVLALAVKATMPDRMADSVALAGRWSAVLASLAMVAVCSTAPLWLDSPRPPLPEWTVPFAAIGGSLTTVFGVSLYWRSLARREWNRRLSRSAEVAAGWALSAAALIGLLLLPSRLSWSWGYAPVRVWNLLGLFTLVVMLGGVVGWHMTCLIAYRFLRQCGRQAVHPDSLPPVGAFQSGVS